MSNYEFYNGTPPHVAGSATSKAAAEDAKASAAVLRARVFKYIQGMGAQGATDQEIQFALDMAGNTERPRRGELVMAGWVRDSGNARKTQAGKSAVVWEAVLDSERDAEAAKAKTAAEREALKKEIRAQIKDLPVAKLRQVLEHIKEIREEMEIAGLADEEPVPVVRPAQGIGNETFFDDLFTAMAD